MKLAQVVTGLQTMEKLTNHTSHSSYFISILITQNGYSFFVKCTETHTIIKLFSLKLAHASAQNIWESLEELHFQSWKTDFPNATMDICYHHSFFALVPSEIYRDEYKSDYLKYNTQLFSNDSISYDENKDFQVHIPFVPYINLHNALLDSFSAIEFTHSIQRSLAWIKKLNLPPQGEQVFLFLEENAFVLLLFKDQHLQMANYFDYQSDEDVVYYCLFALEQYNFDRELLCLSIIGNLSEESQIYNYLYTYIATLKLLSISEMQTITKLSSEERLFFQSHPFLAYQICE